MSALPPVTDVGRRITYGEALVRLASHGQTGVMEVVNGEVSTQVTVVGVGLSRRSNREGDYL
jgi:hypothetical protein